MFPLGHVYQTNKTKSDEYSAAARDRHLIQWDPYN